MKSFVFLVLILVRRYCQIGDLSGKHGAINGTEAGSINLNYTDEYLRFFPANLSLLGRSIVIHHSKSVL